MQLNTCIVSQASTLSLNEKNPKLTSIANKFNISNNDGSDGFEQELKMSISGNIKTTVFNFRDQNSLFYDTETTVNESFQVTISHFYIYVRMVILVENIFQHNLIMMLN